MTSFPGLTYKLINKQLPPSIASDKGYMVWMRKECNLWGWSENKSSIHDWKWMIWTHLGRFAQQLIMRCFALRRLQMPKKIPSTAILQVVFPYVPMQGTIICSSNMCTQSTQYWWSRWKIWMPDVWLPYSRKFMRNCQCEIAGQNFMYWTISVPRQLNRIFKKKRSPSNSSNRITIVSMPPNQQSKQLSTIASQDLVQSM